MACVHLTESLWETQSTGRQTQSRGFSDGLPPSEREVWDLSVQQGTQAAVVAGCQKPKPSSRLWGITVPKPVQPYETAISLSVVCLALQNLGVLHGEKDPKMHFINVMHRRSDEPKVQRLQQGLESRPAKCTCQRTALTTKPWFWTPNTPSVRDAVQRAPRNIYHLALLWAFGKNTQVLTTPRLPSVLPPAVKDRAGLGRGHQAEASLTQVQQFHFSREISFPEMLKTILETHTQEMSNAGIISNTNNSLSFSTTHLYQYFNTTVTRKIAFFVCLSPPSPTLSLNQHDRF